MRPRMTAGTGSRHRGASQTARPPAIPTAKQPQANAAQAGPPSCIARLRSPSRPPPHGQRTAVGLASGFSPRHHVRCRTPHRMWHSDLRSNSNRAGSGRRAARSSKMARSERPRSISTRYWADVAAWAAGWIAHEDRPDATSFKWSIVAVERPCCDPWSVHDPSRRCTTNLWIGDSEWMAAHARSPSAEWTGTQRGGRSVAGPRATAILTTPEVQACTLHRRRPGCWIPPRTDAGVSGRLSGRCEPGLRARRLSYSQCRRLNMM